MLLQSEHGVRNLLPCGGWRLSSFSLMEFYSGKPDNLAASVMDYCTGVLMLRAIDRFVDLSSIRGYLAIP